MVFYVNLCTVISLLVLISINIVRGDGSCKDNDLFCTEKPEYYDNIQSEMDEKIAAIGQKFNFGYFDETDADVDTSDDYNGQNCAYKTEVIQPYTVNVNSTTRVVIQSKFFEQRIKQTTCAFSAMPNEAEQAQCFDGVSSTIKGKCEQKYSTISLYLYDNHKKIVQRYPVRVPVCCYCDISQWDGI